MGNSACCLAGIHGPVPPTPKQGFKVCVCGGAGGIGQPLCLLMAMHPRVWELSVYDLTIAMTPAEGIAADLSHIERKCKVTAYSLEAKQKPVDELEECLKGCKLVLVPAGVPGKDRTNRDLLKINANIAKSIVESCAKFCSDAVIGLMVNPLNSVVPAMAHFYESKGLDPKKICGITGVDSSRVTKFVHEETGAAIESINVPVVGGYSGAGSAGVVTVPLFSQDRVACKIPVERRQLLVSKLRDATGKVFAAKKGKNGPIYSQAYAGWRFGQAVLAGFCGERAVDVAYLKSPEATTPGQLPFFASPVTFGPSGAEKIHPIGKVDDYETQLLEDAVAALRKEIDEGVQYAQSGLVASNAMDWTSPGIQGGSPARAGTAPAV